MSASYQPPSIMVWTIGVGTPVSAFIGAVIGQVLLRRGAKELGQRSRREEVMRNLRWAAELAVSDDVGRSDLGIAELTALAQSELLDDEAQGFVDAALDVVVVQPVQDLADGGPESDTVLAEDPDLDSSLQSGPEREA